MPVATVTDTASMPHAARLVDDVWLVFATSTFLANDSIFLGVVMHAHGTLRGHEPTTADSLRV